MSDELQTLWQSQEVTAVHFEPPGGRIKGSGLAVPTSHFAGATDHRPRGGRFVPFALAAVLVTSFGLWLMRQIILVPPAPLPAPTIERDPAEEIENLLAECRTYSSSEAGAPDFDRAEFACRSVMTLEPLHHEATVLLLRITSLRTCQSDFNQGMEASSSRPDDALDAFSRVTKDCETYFVRANGIAREMVPAAIERAKRSCVDALDEGCRRWVNLECQRSGLADKRVSTWSAAHPDWSCPSWFALRAPVDPPDGRSEVRAELRSRYSNPALGEVLVSYFDGDLEGARARAEALTVPEARTLREDLKLAGELFLKTKLELASISGPRIERAAPVAKEFFDVDARLMLGEGASRWSGDDLRRELARFESKTRRQLLATLARGAYEQGKHFADRKDFRASCRAWKLGSEFSRSDLDLLKALTNVCTRKAAEALGTARTCEEYRVALDYAVDGDGYRREIEDSMAYLDCH